MLSDVEVDLEGERQALRRAREAVADKLEVVAGISGGGADALSDEYIGAVVAGTIEKFQQELVVFGRIDDDRPWRVGLYGIDSGGDQLVIDWRAPFAEAFYQASFGSPHGLERRVSYVGCIDDLFVEDFGTGLVAGSSPLMAELSRSRGTEMRTAVATLQADQDRLVRLDPTERLVLRGGPGTGKTVIGLHRAAWLVYNDTRVTADRILVIGPSDRFLQFVSAVLPTLGEARIAQTTFERLFGPSDPVADDERWIEVVERLEASLYRPAAVSIGAVRSIPETEVAELIDRLRDRPLPWRDRRRVFVESLANRYGVPPASIAKAARKVWPSMTTRQAMAKLASARVLRSLGVDDQLAPVWASAAMRGGGALEDEVRARFEGVPARYSHVIVDEAQDMTMLQLRAVMRRATGVTLVGDDAQRTNPVGIGLRRAAPLLDIELEQIDTAYRMSAEIAEWLNEHARHNDIDAVELVGIRPTGVPVTTRADAGAAEADLRSRWDNVAVIAAGEVWIHKGVEYDGVVVVRTDMSAHEVYLAASRAAHELVVVE